MRIGKFILTIMTFTSFTASAVTSAAPQGPQCRGRHSASADASDIVKAANVTSDTDSFGNMDGRGSLSEKTGDITNHDSGAIFTPEEADQIRKSTGYIACPGTTNGNPSVASAALVGSNMQIVTAVHAFIDKNGKKREPLSDCYFLGQEKGAKPRYFDFASGNFRFGTEGSRKTGDPNDFAVVQLKEAIEGAKPFNVDSDPLQKDEWILGIAAGQESPTRTFPEDEPVVQQCKSRDFQYPANAPVQYITDCDLSPLGSGGLVFKRNSNNELVVKGIFTATGKQTLNGQPYNPATSSFTRVVAVDEDFAKGIEQVRDAVPTGATRSN